MENCLFDIKHLACSYDRSQSNKVLYIDKLQIPKGKLVFLLGASGCGKSTLLEALGLMNNTIASGSIELNAEQGTHINLADLWLHGKEDQLNQVRKNHYSFIFQNTNLMENFTAYENVCLAGMIKKNVSQAAVLEQAQELMNKIKLPESEVNLQTLAVNLSGGQRQRLAFARALTNDATILFGDEPTGNLDEANASELFEIIKSNLDDRITAIVVSHDIDLALKYADHVIVITKEPGKTYGEVKEENIFTRQAWKDMSAGQLEMLKEKLRDFYNTGREHQQLNEKNHAPKSDTSINYKKLFFKKEGKALLGKGYANLGILSLILTFTFLAIGFANGSFDYLEKKLNDPFVNWVSLNVPSASQSQLKNLMVELQQEDLKKQYLVNKVTPFVNNSVRVLDGQTRQIKYVLSRTVNFEQDGELISKTVINDSNVIRSKIATGFKDEDDIGVIVTKNFLQEFGYPEDANYVYCVHRFIVDTARQLSADYPIQIPIRAIVKSLPGKYGMIYTMFFNQSFVRSYENNKIFDSTLGANSLHVFLESEKLENGNEFRNKLQAFLDNDQLIAAYKPFKVFQNEYILGWKKGYSFQVDFDSTMNDLALLNNIVHRLNVAVKDKFDTALISRFFDYSGAAVSAADRSNINYDELSIYFTRLDSIDQFKKYLYEQSDARENLATIQLDDAKVKDKKNFYFLSNVTRIISFLLVIFSTLAVCLFIFNLLRSHLSKVKMNIGTFKAIGLTDRESRSIYFKIILFFITVSSTVSILMATIIGKLINSFFAKKAYQSDNISFFKMVELAEKNSIVNMVTLSTLVIILVTTIWMSRVTIQKILNRTPGDLIYNR